MGGRVGGWEVGRQHGERGGNHLVAPHHRVRTERTAFCPTPGGSVELIQEDRPVYVGPRSAPTWLCSRQFSPQGADSRLADKGRLGSLGGWRAGLCAPAAAYPPLLHT